ncbi:MAG TPA: hypothetical protein VK123_09995 [Candidatus Limnocylindrales bacterium]|nr:hypothetical protein [Candidatus Limnocylindrales bacterium]
MNPPDEKVPRLRRLPLIVRDAEAGRNAERFFVTAVVTLLGIRTFLAVTGYPQIGGRHIHIAHMLWGGLILATALLLLLVSIGRRTRPTAAVLGGAGFGIFIDELGKFLTRDSDYFYRPAIAIIHFVFVAFFLALRAVLARRALTQDECLANAITLMKDMAMEDLDPDEKAQAAALLDRCDPTDPRVVVARGFLERLTTVAAPRPGLYERMRHRLAPRIERILANPRFPRVLAAILVAQSIGGFAWASARGLPWAGRTASATTHLDIGFTSWGEIASSFVSTLLVAAGVVRLFRSRQAAYRLLRRSVRVTVFITQFFVFYHAQVMGVAWLALNVVSLGVLDYLVAREEAAAPVEPAAGSSSFAGALLGQRSAGAGREN